MSARGARPGFYSPRRAQLAGAPRALSEAGGLAKQAADSASAGAISAYNGALWQAAGSIVAAQERVAGALAALERARRLLGEQIDRAQESGEASAAYADEARARLEGQA